MKANEFDTKAWAALLKKIQLDEAPEAPVLGKPINQLIYAFLWWEAKQDQAEDAMAKLFAAVVDVNELRVTREEELIEVLGPRYPLVEERVARLRESLHGVYKREYRNEMASLAGAGKKEQKAYLDTLPGAPSFVSSQVFLLAFGGHAVPVDDKLVRVLAAEGVVAPNTAPEEVESQLLRQVRASDALKVHLELQAYADANAKITLVSPRMTDRAAERPDAANFERRIATPPPPVKKAAAKSASKPAPKGSSKTAAKKAPAESAKKSTGGTKKSKKKRTAKSEAGE